jgi:hypothetical protein
MVCSKLYMIQKVCKVSGMRPAGLKKLDGRDVHARSDSAALGAPTSTGEAVVARSGGS